MDFESYHQKYQDYGKCRVKSTVSKKRQLEPHSKPVVTTDKNMSLNMSLDVPDHYCSGRHNHPQNLHFDSSETLREQDMHYHDQHYQNIENNQTFPFIEQQRSHPSSHLLPRQKSTQPLQSMRILEIRKNESLSPERFKIHKTKSLRFGLQKPTIVSNLLVEHPCANRINGILMPSQMVERIHHAVTKQQRIQALEMANIFFHHDCTEAHDTEIQAGADNALCLKLGYVLLQYRTLEHQNQQQLRNINMMDVENNHDFTNATFPPSQSIVTNKIFPYGWYELSLILSALCKILDGCSHSTRQIVFEQVGKSELLSLMVQVLESALTSQNEWTQLKFLSPTKRQQEEVNYTNYKDCNTNDELIEDIQDLTCTIEKTLRILHKFVKMDRTKGYFINFQNGILNRLLTNFLSCYGKTHKHFSTADSNIKKYHKSIIQATMGIVKDLTFLCVENKDDKENKKSRIFYHRDLIGSIIGILSNYITNVDNIGNESIAMRKEMKPSAENNHEMTRDKIPEYASKALWNLGTVRTLQLVMANESELINILIYFSTHNDEKVSHNCISAIGNLVSVPEIAEKIIKFKNGYLVTKLLAISLDKFVKGIARRRAMRALKCLASTSSASIIKEKNPDFLDSLEKLILTDDDHGTRAQGIEIVTSLCNSLIHRFDQFNLLFRLMLRIITLSEDYKCVEIICKFFPRYISSIYSHHSSLDLRVFSELDRAFCKVATGKEFSIESKLYIARLLHRFTEDEHNRLCLSSDRIIDSLSKLVEINCLEKERVSTHAAAAIVNLSKVEECRRKISSHESVLTNLVNYLVVAPEGSVKHEVKQTILTLLPDL